MESVIERIHAMNYLTQSGIHNGIEDQFEDDICARLDMKAGLSHLPPVMRTAWILYEKGYSEREIASLAGISQEAVSKKINIVFDMFESCLCS